MTKKFLFWIDQAFTNYCLAYDLQKNLSGDYYSIIDCTDMAKSFFQKQSLIDFKKKWFYHDFTNPLDPSVDIDYLSNFETKYKINLWNLAINERVFYRFNRLYKFSDWEILSVLEKECKLFESILDEIKPDYFITKEPPLHHHQLFYELCKAKGVRILMFNQPNTSRCIISTNIRKIDDANLEKIPSKNRTFSSLQDIRKSWNYNKQVQNFAKNLGGSDSNTIQAALRFLLFSKNQNMKTHYTYFGRTKGKVLFDKLKIKFLRKVRKRFIDQHLLKEIPLSKPFIYFPMGVDEERNLLITAPYYTNQVELIRSIAKSIPIGYTLYVKENPIQELRFWRSIDEYKEILSIPNVSLIHPDYSYQNLLESCSLVMTIVGSSGLEAAFYQKPSIVFADAGYSILPSVKKVSSLEQLPQTIREMLSLKVNNLDLDRYVTLLEENLIDFDLLSFEIKYQNFFFYGGILADVDIPVTRMEKFLNENIHFLEPLTSAFIKKIKSIENQTNSLGNYDE